MLIEAVINSRLREGLPQNAAGIIICMEAFQPDNRLTFAE
jgi:hypothetical protein